MQSSTASLTPEKPPLDGSLLFADLINWHIDRNNSFPMFVYPNESVPGSTTSITFLEFGRAAHRVAHALRPGRHGPEGQVVILIANTDTLLHQAVVAGMSIAGLVPFLVSPRNSPDAVVDMMKKTRSSRIVTLHDAHQGLMQGIRSAAPDIDFIVEELPTLAYAFPKLGLEVESDPFVPYPPPASRPDVNKAAIYIHSSGSSGFPKPIAQSYKIQVQRLAQLETQGYRDIMPPPYRLGTMSLPAFHVYGLAMQLYVPIASVVTAAIYAPRSERDSRAAPVMPTTDNILECAEQTRSTVLMVVPAFLEQWATSEEAIEELKKLELVVFAGGPLPVKVGDALYAAGVPVGSVYGGTEFGVPTTLPDKKDIADGDWIWMHFPRDVKVRWDPQGDGTFECQLLSSETIEMAIENLPDVKGYATADLFVKHPTKDLWRIIGRKDDVIILASGEKTVPAPIENIIGSSPLVQGTVMFGRERHQVGILIEPHPEYVVDTANDKAVAEFRNKIWPVVEEANKISPAFSRIFKEIILIVNSAKPMARAGKGTVQKKATLKAYESEIDALYEIVEASSQLPHGMTGPSAWTAEALQGWLMEHAAAISSGRKIDPDTDLFAQGFDSLSVTYLRNRILGALRKAPPESNIHTAASRLSPNIVFENPTIYLLASRLAADVTSQAAGSDVTNIRTEQRKVAINAMIEKYSRGLNGPVDGILKLDQGEGDDRDADVDGPPRRPAVVLLTGSTGGLGSYLLAQLLDNTAVERVYALNRPSSTQIADRQRSAFIDRGLPIGLLESNKLVYVEADAAQDKCGLPGALYDEVRSSITTIIHNAWRLDFNLSLSSFEPNIRATRNLVDLGLASPYQSSNPIRFLFTSSIGSASSWDRTRGSVPEEVILDPGVAVGTGYGESKYVAERIIVQSGLHATSLRIGQMTGGPNGAWATTDWVPIIVKSSITLGALPDVHGIVSWLRPQEVATAILEIASTAGRNPPPPALNIVNPRGTRWREMISAVRDAIREELAIEIDVVLPIVPFGEWFARLEKRAEVASQEDLVNIPAIKLIEFFRAIAQADDIVAYHTRRESDQVEPEAGGGAHFSTNKVQRVSHIMEQMKPPGETEAGLWVRYWHSKVFI
ncbi:acetyl-CoA synthetase-like protein [Phlebopus sp. FC_14]|nr:acetyl-CoA synthetase-like protein [Phlebopus sp. FC_14]